MLLDFFTRIVRNHPDAVAVEIPPGRNRPIRQVLNYAELDDLSTSLAQRIRPLLPVESIAAILLPRTTPDLYIAQLAILKAGAAYTCLDPSFPEERLSQILVDCEAQVLLTNSEGAARFPSKDTLAGKIFNLSESSTIPTQRPKEDPAHPLSPGIEPHHLAYVIYTSGTSGRPKGVMIEHVSIANLVASDLETFQLKPSDRVAQSSSAAYDSSVEEIWLAFASGATLVSLDEETIRLGPDLIPWLQREQITVFCPPPTLLRATGCHDPEMALPQLRLLYVGGEALPNDLADRWAKGRWLVNGYGPTECTVTCLRERILPGNPVTIGTPVSGVKAWVLNDSLEEALPDEPGELCIGGIGLARGYWKRPDLTAEKFIFHPTLGRIYRTGDRVHRTLSGQFYYHGRIDSQVKLRGYRIELGEIEARLLEFPGVQAAACTLQTSENQDFLVAFIVPANSNEPPSINEIKSHLNKTLPNYMVPSQMGVLTELPTTVGGKLNRAALPRLEQSHADSTRHIREQDLPDNKLESRLAAVFQNILHLPHPVSVHDDFFHDLGGNSLSAAQAVTRFREDSQTKWITVRDLYETRTSAALADRAPTFQPPPADDPAGHSLESTCHPFLTTLLQACWLFFKLIILSTSGWLLLTKALPWTTLQLGLVPSILLSPFFAFLLVALYTPLSLLAAVGVKRLLIGKYRALRTPAWGSFYFRNWIVQDIVRQVPWRLLEGTVFQVMALRALGARIGQRVHIHRGVDLLRGGWDLLEIGNDVTLCQDAEIRLVELEKGFLCIGPVTLHDGVTLETRAGVGHHTILQAGSRLSALSSLSPGTTIPANEHWDGIPAERTGLVNPSIPVDSDPARLSEKQYGISLFLARALLDAFLVLPLEAAFLLACVAWDVTAEQIWSWVLQPPLEWTPVAMVLIGVVLSVPLTLTWALVAMRLLGRVTEQTIDRWSLTYLRVWLKSGLVETAGEWLSGTLFWPIWLRAAGMKIGQGCEISTILDVVPELIEIGPQTFFADGIYLGGPSIHQGTVTLKNTRLGTNTFLGNHVVVSGGHSLPDDVLLGISTPSEGPALRAGSSWFGHPPFELPRREVVTMDRHLTHEPSTVRYANRVFWELLRATLPLGPVLILLGWFRGVEFWTKNETLFYQITVVTGVTWMAGAALCLGILFMKWLLLGKVRPGQHALWSCWCSRWDFHYVAWGQWARSILVQVEGTLLLSFYLRAMGMKIGERVLLGPGFAQVVDPDMLEIEDEATVNAMFQAHTFEDRVLKIDRIRVGRRATLGSASVPLYGAQIGENTFVAPHSVIMKGEHLTAGLSYEGAPTRISERDRTESIYPKKHDRTS